MQPTDSLIRKVKQGDSQAAEELCRLLLPEIKQVSACFRGMMDQEDLVQDTMIRIL